MLSKTFMRHPTSPARFGRWAFKPKRRTNLGTCCSSSAEFSDASSEESSTSGNPYTAWDGLTDRLAALSAAPFSVIALPQVVQSFAAISQGNPAALSIISWESIVSYTLGNTLMCSHFASRQEMSGLFVQYVSILNNFLILSQVAYTGHMPASVFACVTVASTVAALTNFGRASGWLTGKADHLWRTFQLASGVIGLAVIPQMLYSVLVPSSASVAPAMTMFAAVCCWLLWQSRACAAHEFRQLLDSLPGTAATLLFCLGPLPQLIKNLLDPSTLGGLAMGTVLLSITGNSLMVPRALMTKDAIWLIGTTWANVAGWLTLLSFHMGRSPVTGARFLDLRAFLAITVLMVVYFTTILVRDTRAKGQTSVFASVAEVFRSKRSPE